MHWLLVKITRVNSWCLHNLDVCGVLFAGLVLRSSLSWRYLEDLLKSICFSRPKTFAQLQTRNRNLRRSLRSRSDFRFKLFTESLSVKGLRKHAEQALNFRKSIRKLRLGKISIWKTDEVTQHCKIKRLSGALPVKTDLFYSFRCSQLQHQWAVNRTVA